MTLALRQIQFKQADVPQEHWKSDSQQPKGYVTSNNEKYTETYADAIQSDKYDNLMTNQHGYYVDILSKYF